MKKLSKALALVLTAAMLLSGSAFAASGDPSGEAAPGMAPPPPPSSLPQNVEDMKNSAAISVIDGVIETDGSAMTGTVTESGIYGVKAGYDGIGDWDGELNFGHYGAVLSGDPGTEFVIGGEEELYEQDGRMYNSVFILGAEDKDEANALGGSETRDQQDAQEGAEGAGIYADMPRLLLDNVYISTDGYGRSAVHLTADAVDTVVRDSTIIASGSRGTGSSAPGLVCMYASARPFLIEASGNSYFYNSDLISSDWGVYSLDGCYNANVYILNCYSENTYGGYSMYALGQSAAPNTCWFYGSYAASAQYGTILCAAGRTYTGALADAPEEALARLDGRSLGRTDLINGWSYIGGYTNAVTMLADMSGAEVVGLFDARHTIFDTLGVQNQYGEPLPDTMDIADYKDDLGIGAAYYFLSYLHGAAFGIRSENVDLTLEDCLVYSSKDVAIQSVPGYDNMASGVKVPDGTEYYGIHVEVKDMALNGDILHEDYQRKMTLCLEEAELCGAVVSGTHAAWADNMQAHIDAGWNERDEELGLDKAAIFSALCYDDAYESIWGVRMSLDGDSSWTVTGDSSLYSLSLEKGAQLQAPAGCRLEIYVDCPMKGTDGFYDWTKGTPVESLEAGDYNGVVILVK